MGKADKPNLLNKINQIEEELRNLNKEKDDLQEGCKHLGDSYLAFSTEHRNSIRVYCSDCKKELRYPTQDEITEWIGKNK
jgi:hypothetical protein|tara:strand:+ start:152 stop:391 length:240 start_codon:yes stop_codon:yes gene_type:complete